MCDTDGHHDLEAYTVVKTNHKDFSSKNVCFESTSCQTVTWCDCCRGVASPPPQNAAPSLDFQ